MAVTSIKRAQLKQECFAFLKKELRLIVSTRPKRRGDVMRREVTDNSGSFCYHLGQNAAWVQLATKTRQSNCLVGVNFTVV